MVFLGTETPQELGLVVQQVVLGCLLKALVVAVYNGQLLLSTNSEIIQRNRVQFSETLYLCPK